MIRRHKRTTQYQRTTHAPAWGYDHDLGYYNAGTDGLRGVMFNMNVRKVDWSLSRGMANQIKQGGLNLNQLSASRRIRDVFTIVSSYKYIVTNQFLFHQYLLK